MNPTADRSRAKSACIRRRNVVLYAGYVKPGGPMPRTRERVPMNAVRTPLIQKGKNHGSHRRTDPAVHEARAARDERRRHRPCHRPHRRSRASSSPRSTAASTRRSPSAASPTAWAARRSSPSTPPRSYRSIQSAAARFAAPSCTTCATAWARRPRSRKDCNHGLSEKGEPRLTFFHSVQDI